MLALSPTTRYCPYCHQTTLHQEELCSRCGKSAELPETVQQALKSAVASTPLQVDPKGAWIDLIATLLTTAGLLCIGYSAIRIATRPLVFLAPIQTAYNRQLDNVEAIPAGAFWATSTPQTPIVVSRTVVVSSPKTYKPVTTVWCWVSSHTPPQFAHPGLHFTNTTQRSLHLQHQIANLMKRKSSMMPANKISKPEMRIFFK